MSQLALNPRQKAAVIVRVMLSEGLELPLGLLPPEAQAGLAQEMALMGIVDRDTRDVVISEFCDSLESVGLIFPDNMGGTLDIIGDLLSQDITDRLRRMAVQAGSADPWDRICALPPAQISDLAKHESIEIAAVLFSKLPVQKAADSFGLMPPERARQIAYAMSMTGGIEAGALRRIGMALIQAAESMARPALDGGPVEKVGAILNFTPANTRDTVLTGLEEDDRDFADEVRKAIFTWANIPLRIDPRDLPRITREVEQITLVQALAGSTGPLAKTAEFILGNLSTRMADSLRDEADSLGKVRAEDAETAMAEIVATIRSMEQAGDLFLIAAEAETDDNPDNLELQTMKDDDPSQDSAA